MISQAKRLTHFFALFDSLYTYCMMIINIYPQIKRNERFWLVNAYVGSCGYISYSLTAGHTQVSSRTVLGRSQHWFRLASSWPSYDVPGMMICMHAKPSWEWHSVILRRSQDRLGKVLQLKISLAPSWDRLGKLPGLIQWWLTDGSSQDHLERLSSIL